MVNKVFLQQIDFKSGKKFSDFLGHEFPDDERFRPLLRAQNLLRQAIRSENSGKYIKLYEKDKDGKWKPVKQR